MTNDSISCAVPTPLTYEMAKKFTAQVRKEMPGLTPAQVRREAARRAGVDYDTFRAVRLGKGAKVPSPITPAATGVVKKLPQIPKPVSPGDVMVHLGSDTPVPSEVASIMDKWVQLRGSGTLTSHEKSVLSKAIDKYGESPPVLYRGLTQANGKLSFKEGQTVRLGPSSFSEAIDAALPYAEDGSGTPVVFVLSKAARAKALRVSDRAESSAGFSEEEWISKGTFTVGVVRMDHDYGVLRVVLK